MEFWNLAGRKLKVRVDLWELEDWISGILRVIENPMRFDDVLVAQDFLIL